jgi:hypothetical protein
MDQSSKPCLYDTLEPTLSSDRLATYLRAAGHDKERALRLYVWNAHIGEAFHLPIQGVEVGLRNCINRALCAGYGANWWDHQGFLSTGDHERTDDIRTAKRRIANKGHPLTTAQIVATLSFGFWVGMLQPRYNPLIWTKYIRDSFPHLPDDKYRSDLADSVKRVADLRNRIWHHEPIFRMSLTEEFRAVMEILRWICPIKEAWIRPNCRVLGLVRQKP